jgi:glycosyltransferase involved in cell wall biosynthesis
MIFLIHSDTSADRIERNLGLPEYSYYFVLKEFRSMLDALGIVIAVTDPAREVDPIYFSARRHDTPCVFLSFAPPHYTPLDLACPTVPIFAWEFDQLPDEVWHGEKRYDWRHVFNKIGRAVTHSEFTVRAVQARMGRDFPIVSIPAPVWDRFDRLRAAPPRARQRAALTLRGGVIDTRDVDLPPFGPAQRQQFGVAPLPPSVTDRDTPINLVIDGIVYCAVFNPHDGRKNWFDLICAFCWAFRETEDATLVIKITHHDGNPALRAMLEDLYKLTPFRCRVLLIDAFLGDEAYAALIAATTYTVNTSHGEGQCLPLMEFMSAGKPAVSPAHTAMADYIDDRNAFIVRSTGEPSHWPHDPRQAFRTLRHRIDWESLMLAYRESYRVATEETERYAEMSRHAVESLRRHCSVAVATEKLLTILATPPASAAALGAA